jgi:hypothetical protein
VALTAEAALLSWCASPNIKLDNFRNQRFFLCFQCQTHDIHWAAYYPMLINATTVVNQFAQRRIFQFFNIQISDNITAMLRSDIILLQIEFVSFAPAMDC